MTGYSHTPPNNRQLSPQLASAQSQGFETRGLDSRTGEFRALEAQALRSRALNSSDERPVRHRQKSKVPASILSSLLVLAALLPFGAQAEVKFENKVPEKTPPRTTVQPFSASEGVERSVANALESIFCASLARQQPKDHEVLCAGDVQALLIQKHVQMELGNCDQQEDVCLADFGQLAQAERLVRGEVSRAGGLYLLSVSVLDPANKKVLARASERAKSLEKLLDAVDGLAKKVVETR